MRLVYLDEAGNTGLKADPDQPIHMIGSLIVEQEKLRPVETALEALADAFAAGPGADKALDPAKLEFHGSLIFSGKGPFKGVPPADRISLCEAIVDCCVEADLAYGWCAVDKPKLYGGHPHMRCFQFTLERVQDYLFKQKDLGLIVADEHHELEEDLIRDLALSKVHSTGWGWRPTKITNIVDTVHFVKSRHNRLAQACDVLTFLSLKALRIKNPLEEKYWTARLPRSVPSVAEYIASNTSVSEKVSLAIGSKIARIEKFNKIWPTS